MVPKVSVVVAAYNVEQYIKKCLNSLKKQTLKEVEFIIVNDGSTDETRKIIEKVIENDERFILYSQDNSGLSSARNTGIKISSARYIAFLDGDDYVKEDMYEKLYSTIIEEKSDLVICGFFKEYITEGNMTSKYTKHKLNNKFTQNNFFSKFLMQHTEEVIVAWNKLFDRKIIDKKNIMFHNKAFFEDVGFLTEYLYNSRKISNINECLMYYVQRDGSITRSFNSIIEESYHNTLNLVYQSIDNLKYSKELKVFEIRLIIYMINYYIKFNKDINFLIQNLLYLNRYIAYLPFKHRFAYKLIEWGLYKKIITRLRGN